MKILGWLLFAIVAIAAIAFAVANRDVVTVDFDPLPFTLDAPLYLIVLASIFGGLVVAAFGGMAVNQRLRTRVRRAERLNRQMATDAQASKFGNAAQASKLGNASETAWLGQSGDPAPSRVPIRGDIGTRGTGPGGTGPGGAGPGDASPKDGRSP
jgi:uncharacterized integral membrane protein